MLAPNWSWIILANVLLGINQGLAWSMTVVMKIDLVGSERRGLAMGLNESAGYVAVALAALATGIVASRYGLRPEPFYLGVAVSALGLALSLLFVRDTLGHVQHETSLAVSHTASTHLPMRAIAVRTSWSDPALATASHVGLVNNLNDGVAWGLFPLFFASAGLSVSSIGILAFVYPAVWGLLQLATGALSDRLGRKWLIAGGMAVQGAALLAMVMVRGFWAWLASGALLGIGTAMVYPTLLAVIGDVAQASWRASAVGMYRLWRDSGYVVGALLAGFLADTHGIAIAIFSVGCLTFLTGVWAALRLPETTLARRRVPQKRLGQGVL
jgi:MFS family permease